jgi:hypothetical protein
MAQDYYSSNRKQKLSFTFFAIGGKSIFSANVLASQSRFPTNEFRLGSRILKPIAKNISLISGLSVGSKIKGTRVYPPGSTPAGVSTRLSAPFHELEETVNSNNHMFIEIPLMARWIIFKSRIGIVTGISFRQFWSNDGYYDSSGKINYGSDFFSNRQEAAIPAGVELKLSSHVSIITIYYFGLTKIYSAYYSQLNQYTDFDYSVKNRGWQIGLEYRIKPD